MSVRLSHPLLECTKLPMHEVRGVRREYWRVLKVYEHSNLGAQELNLNVLFFFSLNHTYYISYALYLVPLFRFLVFNLSIVEAGTNSIGIALAN